MLRHVVGGMLLVDGKKSAPGGPTVSTDSKGVYGFLSRHVYVIVVALIFGVGGMYYSRVFFPELSAFKAMVAGFGFGVFCTIVALGRRFL